MTEPINVPPIQTDVVNNDLQNVDLNTTEQQTNANNSNPTPKKQVWHDIFKMCGLCCAAGGDVVLEQVVEFGEFEIKSLIDKLISNKLESQPALSTALITLNDQLWDAIGNASTDKINQMTEGLISSLKHIPNTPSQQLLHNANEKWYAPLIADIADKTLEKADAILITLLTDYVHRKSPNSSDANKILPSLIILVNNFTQLVENEIGLEVGHLLEQPLHSNENALEVAGETSGVDF